MNRRRRHANNPSVNVALALIVPMLLISIGSFGYASFNASVYTMCSFSNSDYEIEITDCWVVDYKGCGYELFHNKYEVSFNDSNIFPGWELLINTTIHNKASMSICQLNYTISYWNETTGWVVTDETGLFDLFRLQYSSKFYNATGDHVDDPVLGYCESVFHLEHFIFDPSDEDYEKMLCQTFLIKIQIFANPPSDPEGGP